MQLRKLVTSAVTLAAAAATGVVATMPAAVADERPPFYSTPSALPAHNGDIVRSEPSSFFLDPLKVVPSGAAVQRIMYRTTNAGGWPIAVTGTVLTPRSAWLGAGARPIVGYAVGTQGLGDQCAPSRQLAAGSEYEGLFIQGLLSRGYGVVVSDYPGLGTEGVHAYMEREGTGRAVLDSIRAAQRLPEANLPDAGPVAIAGYSQGGGAAASAVELAPTYAPDLKIKGAVAGAIPGELGAVAANLDGSLYFGFLGYAVAGLSAAYGIDPDPLLNARGQQTFDQLEEQCTLESIGAFPFVRSETLTANGEPITALMDSEPFRTVIGHQTIGLRKPAAPVLVTHSVLDDVIPYAVGRDVAERWCDRGADVRLATNLAPTHVGGALANYPEMFAFLEARFAGWPTLSSCWRL